MYSRLAGYEDTNDAERLAQDPTMRIIVGRRGGPVSRIAGEEESLMPAYIG